MDRTSRDIARRHRVAIAAMLMFTLFCIAGYYMDMMALTLTEFVAVVGGYWLVHGLLLLSIFTGHSRLLPDSGLTVPVMTVAIFYISTILYFSNSMRLVFILSYLAVLPFGIFRLSWRGYMGISLLIMVCYTTVVWVLKGPTTNEWGVQHESLVTFAFLSSLITYIFVGNEFDRLRQAYRRKNRELRRAMLKIEELAVTDELTGLYNRRYLLSTLEKQRALADREGLPFALAFVDLDHFKQINDRHGHRIGDQVLMELAQLLKLSIREVDLAARYGGEEFVLLLSGLLLADAQQVMERIRLKVIESVFSENSLPVSVSVGLAQYHPRESAEDLLNRADRLLYDAKREGRNRVVIEEQAQPTVSRLS